MTPVPGYEGLYSVTEDGEIWSEPRVNSKGERIGGKFLTPMRRNSGLLTATLRKDGQTYREGVAELVLRAFVGAPAYERRVVYLDGNRSNVALRNLKWSDVSPPECEIRPVVGYEDRYRVTADGRVWSNAKQVFLSPGVKKSGHLTVSLGGKSQQVHHLVLTAFVGNRPEGMEVLHLNGDPWDNRVENLRWGTRSENMLDSIRHGTNPRVNKTHCPRGHEYVEGNLVPSKLKVGSRQCRACTNARRNGKVDMELADKIYEEVRNK